MKLFFETLGAVRVSAAHHTDNPKSGRVMQKLGMCRVKEFYHPAVPAGHPLSRHVLYVMEFREEG